MKKIEAIIRKTKFEDVKDALLEADIEWFSYYDVRGIGKARQGRIYRGVVYDTSTIERILVSIVVRDKNAENRLSSKPHKPERSVTDAFSSFLSRTPSASAPPNVATSLSITPNRNDNRQPARCRGQISFRMIIL